MAMAVRSTQGDEVQVWPCGENTWSKRLERGTGVVHDDRSWEVRAFAEDASGSGHWPPRSYLCSFCQREFRTAQALGGHMNVHRRERAQANQVAKQKAEAAIAAAARLQEDEVQLRPASSGVAYLPTPLHATELRSPSQPMSVTMSGPSSSQLGTSPESITSGLITTTGPLLFQGMIPIALCKSPPSSAFHQYEKAVAATQGAVINLGRFSACKVETHPETVLDLELRLGQSSS